MPLPKSGQKVLEKMQEEYGSKKGKSVFYASLNKGTLPAKLDPKRGDAQEGYLDACRKGDAAGQQIHSKTMLRGRISGRIVR